ncbi:hypothetical protein [Xanthobacter aminoxidans]|uniref:hypothetical protein n=1 Tax=Xanthobacter aminoxidans TaxID=186280 RepID=UPI002022E370|nr:hypothetical protein [Xanthobacter aminoxidans]MCL8384177.1 hypothetical protein [Xanthobacter aminoxidans]
MNQVHHRGSTFFQPDPRFYETVWGFLNRTEPQALEGLDDWEEALLEDQQRALEAARAQGVPTIDLPAPEWLGAPSAIAFPTAFLLDFYPANP